MITSLTITLNGVMYSPKFVTGIESVKPSEQLAELIDSAETQAAINLQSITRIHLMGGPGSGKSYLAAKISDRYDLPHISLDEIAYQNKFCTAPRTRQERLNMVSTYSQRSCWVAEGVYFSWVGKSLKYAEIIIILKTNAEKRASNIFSKLEKQFQNNLNSVAHLEQLDRLMTSNLEYDELFEKRVSGFIKPFANKILVFNSADEALRILGFQK